MEDFTKFWSGLQAWNVANISFFLSVISTKHISLFTYITYITLWIISQNVQWLRIQHQSFENEWWLIFSQSLVMTDNNFFRHFWGTDNCRVAILSDFEKIDFLGIFICGTSQNQACRIFYESRNFYMTLKKCLDISYLFPNKKVVVNSTYFLRNQDF